MSKKLQEIELRSEEVQEILTRIPHWLIRWGNVLFLSLILMFMFMSWFIKYPDLIEAEALITTVVPPQREYAQTSGQLEKLLVQKGERVTQDQLLAIIENTANYEDIYYLKAVIDTIRLSNKSFFFPIDSIPSLALGEIETAYAVFENDYLQYLINKELRPYSDEALAHAFSLAEQKTRLASLMHQKELNQLELSFKEKDLARSDTLLKQGIVSDQDYENKKLGYLVAERSLESMDMSISQLREAIRNAEKTSKTLEFGKVEKDLLLSRKVIQSFNQLKKSIRDWELRYVLKSERAGIVAFIEDWHENTIVNQGDLVFTVLSDENSAFVAKLKTPSTNFGKIKTGQTVNIKLESYPEAEFGTLGAVITNISLIPNKDGVYLIDARLPSKLITSYKSELDFKQDMRGSAEIITDNLRLTERFFFRLKKAFKNP
ncbi:MAG: HlyD family efflux transporter periplasmic adaptor subunit [Roseivirga sp.]